MLYKKAISVALCASLALGIGALAAPTSANAATVSGTTTFTVKVPPVVVLDYYSQIDLTIDSTAMQSLLTGAGGGQAAKAVTATASGGALTTDAALAAQGGDLSAVNLTINNAYAVRSIDTPNTGSTSVTVTFSAGASTATLTGATDTSSSIGLSGIGTTIGTFGGTGMNPANAKMGDVNMTMDLSNAKSADTYNGASIVITATST